MCNQYTVLRMKESGLTSAYQLGTMLLVAKEVLKNDIVMAFRPEYDICTIAFDKDKQSLNTFFMMVWGFPHIVFMLDDVEESIIVTTDVNNSTKTDITWMEKHGINRERREFTVGVINEFLMKNDTNANAVLDKDGTVTGRVSRNDAIRMIVIIYVAACASKEDTDKMEMYMKKQCDK